MLQKIHKSEIEYYLELSKGNIVGHNTVLKYGHNEDIDTATLTETIWDGGGLWVPPTVACVHNVVSTSLQDIGTVVSSGTATAKSKVAIIDSNATFSSDGVAVGDAVLDDTGGDHSYVTSVDSETQLSIAELHHSGAVAKGNSYRIVTPAGTGASVAHIKLGLDSNGDRKTEFVVMNGTTNVPTSRTYWRIQRIHIDGCGSNSSNVGDITATATAGTLVVSSIVKAAHGQTLQAIDTIPAGYRGYITSWWATINRDATKATTADLELMITPYGFANPFGSRIADSIGLATAGNSYVSREYLPFFEVDPQTDIFINCSNVTENDVKISAGFNMILVKI